MTFVLSRLVAVVPEGGLPVSGMMDWIAKLEAEHGPDLVMRNFSMGRLGVFTPGEDCRCLTCEDVHREDLHRLLPNSFLHAMMTLCPDCGNKRCPKATYHANDCSGSNEPGQEGSVYTLMPTASVTDEPEPNYVLDVSSHTGEFEWLLRLNGDIIDRAPGTREGHNNLIKRYNFPNHELM